MRVVVKHVRQDVLRVLQSLGHLRIVRLKGLVKRKCLSLSLFVDVGNEATF